MTTAVEGSSNQVALSIDGMDCASCVNTVQRAAKSIAGVEACEVNLARGRAVVKFDPARTDPQQIATAVNKTGYHAAIEQAASAGAEQDRIERQQRHANLWFRRAVAGIALWLPVELIHWIDRAIGTTGHHPHGNLNWIDWLAVASSSIAMIYIGGGFYRNAWSALKRRTSDMDTLIAMGSSVAYFYSLVSLVGYLAGAWHSLPDLYFMEASGLLALISLGHWMESRARSSAGRAIHQLLELAPATALRVQSSKFAVQDSASGSDLNPEPRTLNPLEISVAELQRGDIVLVRPGDRVPIDGVVISGRSNIDESMISGESLPVVRSTGDEVIGGTINQDGALQVRVARVGSETALAQIVHLVEHAQSTKPAVQRLADRVAAVFVPSVLLIALTTAIGWFLWGNLHHWDTAITWGTIARSVCSVLIIACPCGLGIAVPATLMVATGRGAALGILFRDIDALQAAEKIDVIVLDKTGTITRGKPAVTNIEPLADATEDEILKLAASAELFSEHPLAKAIVTAARERKIEPVEPSSFDNEPGMGIRALIDGALILVGSDAFLRSTGFQPVPDDVRHGLEIRATGSVVHVARQIENRTEQIGIVYISDEIKPDSAAAIHDLRSLNLRTILLTGDNRAAAEFVAKQVGIDDVRAEVKPADKAAVIRELQSQGHRVAMIGDGINDAPALAQADLGIAIGSGSDIAKETGGVVLVGGSLGGAATAIRLGRATMKKVRQNLFFAFIYNVIAIPFAAFGWVNPLVAAGAMALSDITVIGNALLLRRTRLKTIEKNLAK